MLKLFLLYLRNRWTALNAAFKERQKRITVLSFFCSRWFVKAVSTNFCIAPCALGLQRALAAARPLTALQLRARSKLPELAQVYICVRTLSSPRDTALLNGAPAAVCVHCALSAASEFLAEIFLRQLL